MTSKQVFVCYPTKTLHQNTRSLLFSKLNSYQLALTLLGIKGYLGASVNVARKYPIKTTQSFNWKHFKYDELQ